MKKFWILLSAFALPNVAQAVSLPEYTSDMLRCYGVSTYVDKANVQKNLPNIKIAILERGFTGADEANNLPGGTLIVNQYDAEMIQKYNLNPGYEAPPVDEAHGRRVAQLVWAMTGLDYNVSPQIMLLNANGLTNFRRAVRYSIENQVDIILYAQNWEYGGNYDGKGFINATVDEAIEAGIIWINAAGNYGNQVYNDRLSTTQKEFFNFDRLSRSKNKNKLFFTINSDEKDARVIAVWNDFSDDREYQPDKDLDLYVYEWDGEAICELVGKSDYAQVMIEESKDAQLAKRQASQLAREEISLSGLRKNRQYAVMLKDISGNFSASHDRIRVIVQANEGVLTFNDHSNNSEIMIPADNPGVISVGDLSDSSSTGPTADYRRKPEVFLPPWTAAGQTNLYSKIPYAVFSDDTVVAGTSADAAIFAGIAAVLKANKPDITKRELIQFGAKIKTEWARNSVEVAEPQEEYTYTESVADPSATYPSATQTVIVQQPVEQEIITVYSNPFFVGAVAGGFGIAMADDEFFFGAGPRIHYPPVAHTPAYTGVSCGKIRTSIPPPFVGARKVYPVAKPSGIGNGRSYRNNWDRKNDSPNTPARQNAPSFNKNRKQSPSVPTISGNGNAGRSPNQNQVFNQNRGNVGNAINNGAIPSDARNKGNSQVIVGGSNRENTPNRSGFGTEKDARKNAANPIGNNNGYNQSKTGNQTGNQQTVTTPQPNRANQNYSTRPIQNRAQQRETVPSYIKQRQNATTTPYTKQRTFSTPQRNNTQPSIQNKNTTIQNRNTQRPVNNNVIQQNQRTIQTQPTRIPATSSPSIQVRPSTQRSVTRTTPIINRTTPTVNRQPQTRPTYNSGNNSQQNSGGNRK